MPNLPELLELATDIITDVVTGEDEIADGFEKGFAHVCITAQKTNREPYDVATGYLVNACTAIATNPKERDKEHFLALLTVLLVWMIVAFASIKTELKPDPEDN